MNEPTEKALVPVLRFPEFRGAGEWEAATLGDKNVSVFVKERLPLEKLNLDNYVSTENLLPEYAGVKAASKLPPTGSFTRFKKGDVLISNIRPYLKKVWSANKEGASSNDVIVIRAQTKVSSHFLTCILKNDEFINYIMKGAKGVKMPRGDISLMKDYPIAFPFISEQQKIADCLSSLDQLINAQSQKIDLLKTHKKGLMQQLFPLEGETVPRLRFPEFRGAGEWEEKTLGELSQILRGGSPRPIDEYITTDIDGLNWLKIGDVDQGSKYVTFTKEKVLKTALNKTREVSPGDLIMSNSMSFGRPYILKIKSCIHDGWIAITKIDGRANRDYLYYLILSPTSQEYFLNNAAGSGVQNLNADIIKLLPVPIPKYSEQQKIADCLSSLDQLISAHSQKLTTLKTHKKALMQQLFPALAEVAR